MAGRNRNSTAADAGVGVAAAGRRNWGGRGNDAAQEGKGASEGRSALEDQRAALAQVSARETRAAIFSARFGILCLVFFLNITAGIMFIGF